MLYEVITHLDPAMVEAIPEAPGVYLFYGEGSVRPLGSNQTLQGRALNRRVEVRNNFV